MKPEVIDVDWTISLSEFRVVPDRVKAAERGVSMDAIGKTINATIGGVVAGSIPKGAPLLTFEFDFYRRIGRRAEQIKNLLVRNNRGRLIPLTDVIAFRKSRRFDP